MTAISIMADFTYLTKQTFSSKEIFVAYICVMAFRILNPILVAIKNLCSHVLNKEKNRLRAAQYDMDDGNAMQRQKEHTKNGCLLYSTMSFAYFTGSYRLFNFKNFPAEVGVGLFIDFFLYVLPLLFIQAINNSTLFQ